MKRKFPYFFGQKRQLGLGQQIVLSPFPIKTNMPNAGYCTVLSKRNNVYIDLGGSGGSIFQGQVLYFVFLLMVSFTAGIYFYLGGWDVIEQSFNDYIGMDNGVPQYGVHYENLIFYIFAISAPTLSTGYLIPLSIWRLIKDAKKTVPFRFNRQRREVAMFRWNEDIKSIQVRYFPWEEICTLVTQSTTITPYGMIGKGSLMIAGNDDEKEGHFWVTMSFGTADNNDAVMQWEMIRSFMDDGIHEVSEIVNTPEKLTFNRLIEEYCQDKKINTNDFTIVRRLWWEMNGTRFGIFLYNLYSEIARKHYKKDSDFELWSQPIPESEWVHPSDELNYYNQNLIRNEYSSGKNVMGIGDVRIKYKKYSDDIINVG